MLEPERFAWTLDAIRRLDPSAILSSHLPPAQVAMLEELVGWLAQVPASQPFVAPAQPELEQILARVRATS